MITSNSTDFDPTTISHWKEEGFAVAYLPFDGDAKAYRNSLQHLADPLELGDKYAIVGTVLYVVPGGNRLIDPLLHSLRRSGVNLSRSLYEAYA